MRMRLSVLSVLFALLLVSCGGGSGPSDKINVTMTDFHYTPDVFTIPAGQTITINIRNDGAVLHEFVLMKPGLTIGESFGPEDEENIYWEVEVDPGQSKTETFTAPTELGDYQVVCGTEGHFAAGMVGSLKIVEPKE